MVNNDRRICCVEGFYEYEDEDQAEPTIKPMLQMLSQWKYWPHCHNKCRTIDHAKRFLGKTWRESPDNSVLFFATHGCPGKVTLSKSISLGKLGDCLSGQCKSRYVHFSACNVLEDKTAVEEFLRKTGAAAVSGYRTDVGWAGNEKPAVLSDLMLLNQLWEADIDFSPRKRKWRKALEKIELDLQRRFGDCQFKIVQRER